MRWFGFVLFASCAWAHPMGNFSIGQHATLAAGRDALEVRYVLDLAEVPTYNLKADLGLASAAALTPADAETYRVRYAPGWFSKLAVTLGGKPVALAPGKGRAQLAPGAGGLPTVRFEVEATGAWPAGTGDGPHELTYRDSNFEDVVGWKQVVVRAGAGATLLSSTAPATDDTAGLTTYPDGAETAPRAVREAKARVQFTRADPRVAPSGPVTAAPPAPPGRQSTDALAVLALAAVVLAGGGLLAARRS